MRRSATHKGVALDKKQIIIALHSYSVITDLEKN